MLPAEIVSTLANLLTNSELAFPSRAGLFKLTSMTSGESSATKFFSLELGRTMTLRKVPFSLSQIGAALLF